MITVILPGVISFVALAIAIAVGKAQKAPWGLITAYWLLVWAYWIIRVFGI